MGEAYLIAGIPQRAIEEYGRALEIDPSFRYSNIGRAWAYSTMGDYRNVIEELEKVGELPMLKSPAVVPFMKAFMLSRAGRYREANQEIDRGIEIAGEQDAVWVARFHLLSALLAVETGDYSSSLETTEKVRAILAEYPKERQTVALATLFDGIAEARAGRLEAARQHLASLEEAHEPREATEKGWYHFLQGEIALAEGNTRAAIHAFAAGEPEVVSQFSTTKPFKSVFANLSFRDGLARAKAAEGDREGAIEIYRKLTKPDLAQKWTAAMEPRYVLELARLLDESGNSADAIRNYQRFVEMLKDADPGLPELQKVIKRLST
jgi:tetratricopeptide (TPR) repeat protein